MAVIRKRSASPTSELAIAFGRVGDEHDHVSQVLHRHYRAHVGRGEGDDYLGGKLDAGGALDEFHGYLGVLTDQVQRSLMWH